MDRKTFELLIDGHAEAIRAALVERLREAWPTESSSVFFARSETLTDALAPVLVWLRDHRGIVLSVECLRASLSLPWLCNIARQTNCLSRDRETGADVEPAMPHDVIAPLRTYLAELPGYDPTRHLEHQPSDEPRKQHSYVTSYFTRVLHGLELEAQA